jgi:hypothetical protein
MKDRFRGETEELIEHDSQCAQHQSRQHQRISIITLKKFSVVDDANHQHSGYKM